MNAVKRIVFALGALCAVGLFAAVCGLSAVWAVRHFASPAAVSPPQAPPVQTPPVAATPPPPAPAAPPEPPSAAHTEPASGITPGVYSWSLTRVMERSHTGRELRRYADDYVKVLNASIAELDRALKGKDRRLNVAEAQKMRAQFVERRDGMTKHTGEFLARIVAEAAGKNEAFGGVSLIEEKYFTRLGASADLTTKVIETIDHFHMQLPPLPRPLKLPVPANPAPPKKGR